MITTLAGSNSFLISQNIISLETEFLKDNDIFGLEKIDAESLTVDQIQSNIESLPFLTEKKLVIIKNLGLNKKFLEKYESLIEKLPQSVDLILIENKLDKRSTYFKYLKKNTRFLDCTELDSRQLPVWLIEQAKLNDASISISDARYLVERVAGSQLLLYNELQKLIDYKKNISRSSIELLTELTPNSTVFQLLDAAFASNTARALKIYDEQRSQKVDPMLILSMIVWQLHIVALIKAAGTKPTSDISNDTNVNLFVLQKSSAIAAKLTMQKLKKLIRKVSILEFKIKSLSIDTDDALCQLIIDISNL